MGWDGREGWMEWNGKGIEWKGWDGRGGKMGWDGRE